MSGRPNYWWQAFVARPSGMPVPPNWFALAAFGLLGAFLTPGFWLLGAGLEVGYLALLGNHPRFRRAVDAAAGVVDVDPVEARYTDLLRALQDGYARRHRQVETRAREILARLDGSPLMGAHADSLQQLVWLHLRLLVARQAIGEVVDTGQRERDALQSQEDQLDARLAEAGLDAGLRRSLEQQKAVIDQRQAAHADGARRLEHVESELQRIDQQIALIREQSLLASDEGSLGRSLDALAASFNEANRWLDGQRDLIGALAGPEDTRLPRRVLQGGTPSQPRSRQGETP